RRSFDRRAGDHVTTTVVIVEAEIVFQGVGTREVVAAIGEAKDDAARSVFAAGYRLEADRHQNIVVLAAPCGDYVEFVLDRALHECASGASARHLLDGPAAGDRVPAAQRPGEIEPLLAGLRRKRRAATCRRTGTHRRDTCNEPAPRDCRHDALP